MKGFIAKEQAINNWARTAEKEMNFKRFAVEANVKD